jgi:hypothetical protein
MSDDVKGLRAEAQRLKELLAEALLEWYDKFLKA